MNKKIHIQDNTILIGGLPEPIGGVTTFLSRLLRANLKYVVAFVDLYPAKKKSIPPEYQGKMYSPRTRFGAYLGLFLCMLSFRDSSTYLFNFSRLRSLLLFIFLPKFKLNKWQLILHHGDIKTGLPLFLATFLLKRFDLIYAIGSGQMNAYREMGIDTKSLECISTYIPPTLSKLGETEYRLLDEVRSTKRFLIIASGFPRELYRHDLAVKFVEQYSDTCLALFLYGNGELLDHYKSYKHDRIRIFWNQPEDVFNYVLSQSNLYVRPTQKDSFGIACADAVSFGVPVIASAVCQRADGVQTYPIENDKVFFDMAKSKLEEFLCLH